MKKRFLIVILQLLVTAGTLSYAFYSPHKRTEIRQALGDSEPHWLLLGWMCYGLVEALATIRWQMLLRVQKVAVSWLHAGAIVIIGLFFNMFLPGLVGGDAMRLYLVFREAPEKKTGATLSVAIDRIFGLLSILILATIVGIWRFRWLARFPITAHVTYLALFLLGGATFLVCLLLGALGFGWVDRLPARFPWRKAIVQAGVAIRSFATRPGICLLALGLTLMSHLAYYISYYCAARSLTSPMGKTVGLFDFLSIMPLVNTITGIPISFGGVGVRETLFQTFLGSLVGVPAAPAALAASLGYAIQASWGLAGGASYLLLCWGHERRRKARRARVT